MKLRRPKSQEAAQVTGGHYGCAIAHQRVVSVVPLGPLSIEPNTRLGHKVAELSQQGHQHFFGHVDVMNRVSTIKHQTTVGPELINLGFDLLLHCQIKVDGVLRIHHDVVIGLNAIRHVGVGENVFDEKPIELTRIVLLGNL